MGHGDLLRQNSQSTSLGIFHAATWSGLCTFAQFYRLDFSGGGFDDAVLEMATRAGSP